MLMYINLNILELFILYVNFSILLFKFIYVNYLKIKCFYCVSYRL